MQSCSIVYTCPHCNASITIIGDPAPAEKLLAIYLAKKPVCVNCKKSLNLSS